MRLVANKDGSVAGDRLTGFDFCAHNAEIKPMLGAFDSGKPTRTPIVFGTNARYFMLTPDSNADAVSFRTYTEDPDVMFDVQLQYQRWMRFNLLQDIELGLPTVWRVAPDFQNFYEASWFGCKVHYLDDQVPDTRPEFADDPERIMEDGPPDPFGGIMARALEYCEHFKARAARETFLGRPIEAAPAPCGLGSDGPMTLACNLFGPEFVCTSMIEDPERLHRLLDFITEATIARMAAWRKRFGIPTPMDRFSYGDDSVALISTSMFREHILPYHRRLCDAFGTNFGRMIHLCGDATRHFPMLRDELNIRTFDTGFPVNFGGLRKALGPNVCLQGGPHVELLLSGSPQMIYDEVRRITQTGVLEGGMFILREGNNLAPRTPLENTEALYRAGREFACDT